MRNQKSIGLKTENNCENINEITIEMYINKIDNKNVYFLDNTTEDNEYYEKGQRVIHLHDNLKELHSDNTTLIINGKKLPFAKSFIPVKFGVYKIKLIFKIKLTNCAYMFCGCSEIKKIDFSKFNTEDVTDMQSMFRGCTKLIGLNLKSFNTKNVTNMAHMFEGSYLVYYGVKSFSLPPSFNTENVTYMQSMFRDCRELESLHLESFNTEKVTDMNHMFSGCCNLAGVYLNSFNTKNVTNMSYMFEGDAILGFACYNGLDFNSSLSSFNTENVTDMQSMFRNCYG